MLILPLAFAESDAVIGYLTTFFKLQFKDLPIYLPGLVEGTTVQVAVAVVTSKGLQDHHVGKWMATLSSELFTCLVHWPVQSLNFCRIKRSYSRDWL